MPSEKHFDSEDLFADTRMSFGDHLEELRQHLWKAIYGFLVALCFSFFIGWTVLEIIAAPVESQLEKFHRAHAEQIVKKLESDKKLQEANQPKFVAMSFPRRQLESAVTGKPVALSVPPNNEPEEAFVKLWVRIDEPIIFFSTLNQAQGFVTGQFGLRTLSVQEAFMAYFKVCLACGFVLGSPWIFYQIWLFVAAGLYPREKRLVHVYLPMSVLLFLGGVALCQFIVIPRAIEALLWFNHWIGMMPDVRFNEWLSFAILMPLVFGLSFQTPLVMLFLERLGLMTAASYQSQWRMALFLIHVFAAVITPSVDPISMELLALPMFGLYGLGIFLSRLNSRRQDQDIDAPDSEELVKTE